MGLFFILVTKIHREMGAGAWIPSKGLIWLGRFWAGRWEWVLGRRWLGGIALVWF